MGLRKCTKCKTSIFFAFFSLVLWVFSRDFATGWSYHRQLYCLLLSGLFIERILWKFLNFLTIFTLFLINSTSWLSFMFFCLPTYYKEPSKFPRKTLPVFHPYSTQLFLWQTQWVKNTQRFRCNLWVSLSWQKTVVNTALNRGALDDMQRLILLRTSFHSSSFHYRW